MLINRLANLALWSYQWALYLAVIVHELGHAIVYKIVARKLPDRGGRVLIMIGTHQQPQPNENGLKPRWTWGSKADCGCCHFPSINSLSVQRKYLVIVAGMVTQAIVAVLGIVAVVALSLSGVEDGASPLGLLALSILSAMFMAITLTNVFFIWLTISLRDSVGSDTYYLRQFHAHFREQKMQRSLA